MKKRIIVLVCFLITSVSANAAILSIGSSFGADTITRDTDTGLDWLDLTETNGRSYNEISGLMGPSQEFAGYRYAGVAEVQQLWKNFGLSAGTDTLITTADTVLYTAFINAVTTLGNTAVNNQPEIWDYGALGVTGSPTGPAINHAFGLFQVQGDSNVSRWGLGSYAFRSIAEPAVGSYLVAEVPVPPAGLLFMTALVGLVGKMRISRRNAS